MPRLPAMAELADLPAVPNRTLRKHAKSVLETAILTGRFAPGARLNEVELAQHLGTSRGPIREALLELEQQGLVSTIPHRGTFVAAFEPADLREISSLRTALEEFAARQAVVNATSTDLAALDAALDQLLRGSHSSDPRDVEADHFAFHREFVRVSGHRRLFSTWLTLAGPIQLFLTLADRAHTRPDDHVGRHRILLEALRSRDSDAAAAAVREHLAQAGDQSVDVLSCLRTNMRGGHGAR